MELAVEYFIKAHSSGTVFYLTAAEWSAIASAAQALAALGAIALLIVTLISQRDAREANRHARKLAGETEALVRVSRAAQELAVKPIVEISLDRRQQRVYLTNRGNGPLVRPQLSIGARNYPVITRDDATGEYRELGALAAGVTAFAVVEDADQYQDATISGWSMTGNLYRATANISATAMNAVVVAIESDRLEVAASGGAEGEEISV